MTLSDYTTFLEIRAALGVSSTELPDEVLAIPSHEVIATMALEDVSALIPDYYVTMVALSSKTKDQQRFIDLVKLYTTYVIAKSLLTSLPLFSVRSLTDGRASFERFVGPFQDTRDGVDASLISLKYRLAAVYTALTSIGVAPRASFIVALSSSLAIDPVTNA